MQKRNKREEKKTDLNEASIIDTDHTFGMQSMRMAMNGKRAMMTTMKLQCCHLLWFWRQLNVNLSPMRSTMAIFRAHI